MAALLGYIVLFAFAVILLAATVAYLVLYGKWVGRRWARTERLRPRSKD